MKEPTCPTTHALAALLVTEAVGDGGECAEHLERCPDCRRTLADLAADAPTWEEVARRLPRVGAGLSAAGIAPVGQTALERVLGQLKKAPPLLWTADPVSEEADVPLSFLRSSERPDLLGTLGAYEVVEVLGRGGMGVVLKALDPALNRVVAIKVLAPCLASSGTARRRFVREGRAAAAVCHDHVVTVHGVSETDGLPYLVMQYVAGESLQARLDRVGPLEVTEIVRIGLQTAAGLAAAHAQGLIHRDIKPANLLLEGEPSPSGAGGRIKITDFGLARTADDVGLTQDGVVAGTPEYMAPEQARGEPVDHRADLFSLGSVMFAMATGRPPFKGATTVAVLRQVSDEAPPLIRSLNPAIPAWLITFISRLLAKHPADRFQSAAEVATLLESYLAHLRQPATVPAPELSLAFHSQSQGNEQTPGRWQAFGRSIARHPWRLIGVLLVVVGLGTALLVTGSGSSEPPMSQAIGAGAQGSRPASSLQPKDGLVCLLVNKKSGRCLSIKGGSANPGARIVQGPLPDQAGATEHWLLLASGKAFRLHNASSRLVLEIGNANPQPGVQAIQWHDQATRPNQHWTFEPIGDDYVLRAGHSDLVLSIREGAHEAGAAAVQWEYIPDIPEELWELRPTTVPAVLAQDFRGGRLPVPPLKLFGQASAEVRPEDGGLRITLPANRQKPDQDAGVLAQLHLAGDFEITGTYQLLAADPPQKGWGAGISLNIRPNWKSKNWRRITRLRQPDGDSVYMAGMNGPAGGARTIPTTAQAGQLRLVRQGSILHYLASEEAGGAFRELTQEEFGTEEVGVLRFMVTSNGSPTVVDARLIELQIRLGKSPPTDAAVPAAEQPPIESQGRGALLAVALLAVLALPLSLWLYVRRNRQAGTRSASAPVQDGQANSDAAAPSASFPCPECGKKLKGRGELAGKKVKCPHCGRAVRVPDACAAEDAPPS
jgi:serine/threonine protein kinase